MMTEGNPPPASRTQLANGIMPILKPRLETAVALTLVVIGLAAVAYLLFIAH